MNGKTKIEKSLFNVFFGLVNKIILIIFPFIIKTVIIKKLGNEYLGLNSLFTSLLQMLSLAELGFGSAMVYAMYKPLKENDSNLICKLLKEYKKIYLIIGSIIGGVGCLLMPLLPYLIESGTPNDINIYILYFIYLFNTTVSYFLFAYRKSLFEADQKNGVLNIINAFVNLMMYILQIVILLNTSNYYFYVLVIPLATILNNIISFALSKKEYSQYYCNGELEEKEKKKIFRNVFSLFGHSLGSMIIISIDGIILSSYLGLNILAIYSNYHYMLNAIGGVVVVFYTSILASVGNIIISTTKEKMINYFMTLNFINNFIVGLCTVCLICLYQPFMELWVGKQNMFDDYIAILFGIYFYSMYFRRIGLTFKEAAGMWKEDFWKPYIGVLVKILLSISLIKIINVSSVLVSTIFVMLFVYYPWETKVLFNKLFIKNKKKYLLKNGMYFLVTFSCLVIIMAIIKPLENTFIMIFIRLLMCLVIYFVIFLVFFWNSDEIKEIKKIICDRIYKRSNKL